ncbi:MAG: AAA family ATPase [Flavobacteriales bacterium]|nr:AAA family ATPase [Flavobacteriales bacterium]
MENTAFTVIKPGSPTKNFVSDAEFEKRLILHLVKNRIGVQAPLILAIQGATGEGKTSQTLEFCKRMGVTVIFLHGSSIGSEHEHVPVQLVQNAYLEASRHWKMNYPAILFLDDIDTSIASVKAGRTHTINSSLVNGLLMNLADNPTSVGSEKTERVPIIITGNDMTSLYRPLTRTGRMRVFPWEPDNHTKLRIACSVFEPVCPEGEDFLLKEVLTEYLDQPISFFVDVRGELIDHHLIQRINRIGKLDFANLDKGFTGIGDQIHVPLELIKHKLKLFSTAKVKNYII